MIHKSMKEYQNQLSGLADSMGLKLKGYDNKVFRGTYRKKFYMITKKEDKRLLYLFADPGGNRNYSGAAIPVVNKYELILDIFPKVLPNWLTLKAGNRIKSGNKEIDKKYRIKSGQSDVVKRIFKIEGVDRLMLDQFPAEMKLTSDSGIFDHTPEEGKASLSLLFINEWVMEKEILERLAGALFNVFDYLKERRFLKLSK